MLGAFAEALMSGAGLDAVRRRLRRADRGAGELAERLRPAALGHPGRDDRAGRPETPPGGLLARVLAQPRRRAEQALVAVVCQAYVEGVSTRRVDDLVKAMGIEGISKSEVSRLAAELDGVVAEFKERPLDGGPYRYLWIDALTQRVREGGRVVNVSAVIATAVNAEGRREIVGFDIVTTEDTAAVDGVPAWPGGPGSERGWSSSSPTPTGASRRPSPRYLSEASWQRCRTHFMANLASRCAKGNWPMIATLVRSIFEQPDRDTTWSQLADVTDKLTQAGFCDVVTYLLDAADDILAFSAFPVEHWPKIRSNNPQERLNKEIRRRTDVVGIFPNRAGRHPPGRGLVGRADRRVGHHQALHERRVTPGCAPTTARASTTPGRRSMRPARAPTTKGGSPWSSSSFTDRPDNRPATRVGTWIGRASRPHTPPVGT